MKLFYNNHIYVQKIDLVYLYYYASSIPQSILNSIYQECINTNKYNKCDFVKFSNQNDIEYLKNIDWIIDYHEVKNLNNENLEKLVCSILEKADKLEKKIKFLSLINENNDRVVKEWILYNYKYFSLQELRKRDNIKKLILYNIKN